MYGEVLRKSHWYRGAPDRPLALSQATQARFTQRREIRRQFEAGMSCTQLSPLSQRGRIQASRGLSRVGQPHIGSEFDDDAAPRLNRKGVCVWAPTRNDSHWSTPEAA